MLPADQSVFSRKYVITAAHCQHKRIQRLQIAEVVLGEWDLGSDPDPKCDENGVCKDPPETFLKAQRFEVTAADIIVHEDWDLEKGIFKVSKKTKAKC